MMNKKKTQQASRNSLKLSYHILFVAVFLGGTLLSKGNPSAMRHENIPAKSIQEQKADSALHQLRDSLQQLSSSLRFQQNSAVLPAASIHTLDSILQLMQERPAYQYLIRVNCEQKGWSEADRLDHALYRAGALRQYMVSQGIPARSLLIEGTGMLRRGQQVEIIPRKRNDREAK